MLPPFKVRQLRLRNPFGPPDEGQGQVVIRISSTDYDKTISKHPEAALSYMDEDDGEIITVGSSLELQQRLDEPILLPPTSPVTTPMHTFDINTQETGTLDVWRNIVTIRDSPADNEISSLFHEKPRTMTGAARKWWQDSIMDFENKRQRYFEATEPPQPAINDAHSESPRDRQLCSDLNQALTFKNEALLRGAALSTLNQSSFQHRKEGMESSLTNEGRRQARNAGAKLRCSTKYIDTYGPKSNSTSEPEKAAHQDRWASYGRASQETFNQVEGQANADESTGGPPLSTTVDPVLTKQLAKGNDTIPGPTLVPEKKNSSKPTTEVKPLATSVKRNTAHTRQIQRPLLEAFEAELAGLVDQSFGGSPKDNAYASSTNGVTPLVASTEDTALNDTSQFCVNNLSPSSTRAPLASELSSPGDLFTHTIRSFVDGVGLLASDLRTTLPEAHDHIALAQQHMPQAFEQVIRGAFRGFGAHVLSLANFVQEAAAAAGDVADRAAQLETEALIGAVEGLQKLALGVGEISQGVSSSVPPDVTAGSREGNGKKENVKDKESGIPLNDEALHLPVAPDGRKEADGTIAASVRLVPKVPHTVPGECLHPEALHIPQNGIASVAETVSSDYLESSPKAVSQGCSPIGERKSENPENQALPTSTDVEGLNMSTSKKMYTPEEYESIHQKKREEAADKRQTDRLRLRNLLVKTTQREGECSVSNPSTPIKTHAVDVEVTAEPLMTADRDSNHDHDYRNREAVTQQLNLSNPLPPPPPPPPLTISKLDFLGLTPRACDPGHSVGPGVGDKHCTTSDLPCSPPNELSRGRCPRRSLSFVSPRVPYEYIVASPDCRDQVLNDRQPSMPVLDKSDEHTRSRSPPIRRHMYRSPPRRPPPGWPRFPRHGPIHLPHDTIPQSSEVRYGSRSSNAPRIGEHSGRSKDSDLEQRHASSRGSEETQISRQQHQPISTLRHRQSWHPGFHGRPLDGPRARVPANPPLETATVRSNAFSTADTTHLGELRHSQSFAAARDRKPTFWTHVTPQADDRIRTGRDLINSSDHDRTAPKFGGAEGAPIRRTPAKDFKLVDNINGNPPRHGSLALKRANTVAATASDRQRDAPRPYHISPAPPPPFPAPEPTSSEELIQPSQFPEMNRFPSLRQFENAPSTFRYSPPFPPLPSMNPLIPTCVTKPSRSNNPFSSQIPLGSNDRRVQNCSPSASEPHSGVLRVQNTSAHFPSHSIERGHEVTPGGSDICSEIKALPARPAGLGPPEPGARLARPFDPLDPLAESVTLHRNRLIQGVRRSATERRPQPDRISQHRRSYPRYHDTRRFSLQQQGKRFEVTEIPRTNANQFVDFADHHEDMSTVGKVQECVEQLKVLGFGTAEDGGVGRLVVYAQAANGELEAAMEIIDEERKAYQQNASFPRHC